MRTGCARHRGKGQRNLADEAEQCHGLFDGAGSASAQVFEIRSRDG
jgi:hypothetical protein